MSEQSALPRHIGRWLSGCLLLTAGLAGCDDYEPLAPAPLQEVLAVLELSFTDIGKPRMSSTLAVAPSLAEVDSLGAGSGAAAGDVLEAISTGVLDHTPPGAEGRRMVHSIFRAPGLFPDEGFDETLDELVLIAVATASTIDGTAVRRFAHEDGSAAQGRLAAQVQAVGRPRVELDGIVRVDSLNVIRVLAPADLSGIQMPAGIIDLLPQAFVVRRADAEPEGGSDGMVTFGFSLPLLEPREANPTTLSVMLVAAIVPRT